MQHSLPELAELIQSQIEDFDCDRDIEGMDKLRKVLERSMMAANMRKIALEARAELDLDSAFLCEGAADRAASDAQREAWG